MAIIAEIESALTGLEGVAGAQSIAAASFTARAAEGAGSLHPALMTATLTGSIVSLGDQDFYAVYLAAGERVILDIDGVAAPLDLTMLVYSPSASLVSTVPGSTVIDPGSASLADPYLDFTVSATGLWVFGIRAEGADTGAYTLNITRPGLPVLFVGGDGPETSPGSSWADTLGGGGGADSLSGGAGADSLDGGTGNDTLLGGAGADTLRGGDGDDLLVVGDAGENDVDIAFGGDGADTIIAYGSRNTLRGEGGNDLILGGTSGDTLDGGDGADTILGDPTLGGATAGWNDTLMGGAGDDSLAGMLGADRLVGDTGNDTLWGDRGDALDDGDGGRDTLLGGPGSDSMEGNGGDDLLNGAAGNDTLVGGTGMDRLLGGAGADLLLGGRLADGGVDQAPDTMDGGAGADTLQGAPLDRLLGGDGDDLVVVAWQDPFTVFGTAALSTLADGGAGLDVLRLRPGAGSGGVVVALDLGAGGTITIAPDESLASDPLVIRFAGFERLDLAGSAGTDLLRGAAGADTLRGAGGVGDDLAGGEGDDVLLAADDASVAIDAWLRGEGGADWLVLNGAGSTGMLDGGAGADTIDAASGTEAIAQGGEGDDLIRLGLGNHIVDGGAGGDILVLDRSRVDGAMVVWQWGDGDGMALSDAYFIDFAGIERFAITGGIGADELRGGTLADTLDGGAGADTMWGGLGNDLYGVDSLADVLVDSGGVDTVRSSINWTMAGWQEALELVAPGTTGTGNGSANLMTGGAGSQTLYGAGGDDTLDGGPGADSLNGGPGNDLYRVDDAGDRLVDSAGNDTVEAAISWNLGTGFEVLRLVGSGSANGGGNAGDNLVVGNAFANALSGSGGADTLDGGGGADRLTGGTGDDLFVLRLAEARGDRIMDFAGNGEAAGDMIVFVGYGAGATVVNAGADTWRVEGAAGWDTFTLTGIFNPLLDVRFVDTLVL